MINNHTEKAKGFNKYFCPVVGNKSNDACISSVDDNTIVSNPRVTWKDVK